MTNQLVDQRGGGEERSPESHADHKPQVLEQESGRELLTGHHHVELVTRGRNPITQERNLLLSQAHKNKE